MIRLSRRAVLLGGFSFSAAAGMLPASRASGQAPAVNVPEGRLLRVASMDFGLAETLIEMGLPPIALPNPGIWADWVVEPELPADIVNLGTDREPNLELLAALKPDLIVTTPYLDGTTPLLEAIAPTRSFSVYAPPAGHPYERSITATRQLAAAIGFEAQGEALIARAEATMATARQKFIEAGIAGEQLLIVQFLDTHHVRVYGTSSLFGDVLERTGLVNGWTRPSNYWGFTTVGIEALAESPASRMVYLEPVAPDLLDALAASPLWNSLPFVRTGRMDRLPSALMFGMLPSAMRFARQLALHLTGENGNG